jgi:hypothetical protein
MIRIASVALIALALLIPATISAQPSLEYVDSGQWTFQKDCAVQGDLVATVSAYGFALWDAGDPAAPVFVSDVYFDGQKGVSVDWEGDLVTATDETGKLYLIDVSTPSSPVLIQKLSGTGAGPDVFLRRDGATRWCYTAGNASLDFQIRDLTNPASPVTHGSLNVAGTPNSLVALGDLVILGGRSSGIHTIDVSDPDNPELLDNIDPPGTHYNVTADGNRAAIASSGSGFTLFDITDPANIVQGANVLPAAGAYSSLNPREVIIQGTTLWAICESGGALVYDISNLNAPVLTGYDPILDSGEQTPPYYVFYNGVLSGGKLYLGQWNGIIPGVVILDATVSTVDYLGRVPGYDYVRDVDVENGFVYGCTGHFGIIAHQHLPDGNMIPRGQLQVDATWGVDGVGTLAYIASADEGLVIGDFSDPDNPVRRGEYHTGQARQVTVIGDVAYVASFSQGFHTVDVSDPDSPFPLDSETRPDMESVNLSIQGNLVATADSEDGVNFWDISNPEDLIHLGNYPMEAYHEADDVIVDGDIAYISVSFTPSTPPGTPTDNVAMHVVDIGIIASPTKIRNIAPFSTGATLNGGYLHVSRGTAGLTTYHQSVSPEDPIELAVFNTTDNSLAPASVTTGQGHFIYIADYSGVVMLRLDPDTPLLLSFFDLAWDGEAVTVTWSLAEEMSAENLRLSVTPEGGQATELAILPLDTEGLNWQAVDTRLELAAGGDWSYELQGRLVGDEWIVLRSELLSIDLPDADATPAPAVALSAHPNPFNPSTQLSFELPVAGHARLSVYDLSGRRVALIHDGSLAAGPNNFEWDGSDEAGSPLASGVYLARLNLASGSWRTKLVMIR